MSSPFEPSSETPREPSRDPFAPPKVPCEVQCVHCGESYESWLIEWRDDTGNSPGGGFWCCPTPGCDGIGFGFDIFPVDPAWTDENGEHLIQQFDDEEDDEDDDEAFIDQLGFDDDDEDEDSFELDPKTVDTFDANAFWISMNSIAKRVGNSPQPPFNLGLPGKSWAIGEDDIPF